jgi:hypothetical protein
MVVCLRKNRVTRLSGLYLLDWAVAKLECNLCMFRFGAMRG